MKQTLGLFLILVMVSFGTGNVEDHTFKIIATTNVAGETEPCG